MIRVVKPTMLFLKSISTLLLLVLTLQGLSQSVTLAKPSLQQLAFQDLELGVFIYYSIDAYADAKDILVAFAKQIMLSNNAINSFNKIPQKYHELITLQY